jgi:hypothetical protein
MLFDIIVAAHYLQIKPLVDVGTKTVANKIRGMNPTEIRNVGRFSFFLLCTTSTLIPMLAPCLSFCLAPPRGPLACVLSS